MYILECSNGSYYTGSTVDLKVRLAQHERGEGANYTKKNLPVRLVYCERYVRVEHAFRREKQIQRWTRAKKKALIEGRFHDLSALAKKIFPVKAVASIRPDKNRDTQPPEASKSK